jgi:SHS family sialic acid transporter-like MFS transporter
MQPNNLPVRSPRGQWLALTAALLGWMFDGLEMGLFPLVARPALRDMLQSKERADATTAVTGSAAAPAVSSALEAEVGLWFAIITAGFLIGAATGGVLFGWLGDRIGRVRAMTLSILTYAVFSGACGLAASAWQVAAFRVLAALGMGGEWSLGVALVMEVWPDRSRKWLAGIIGAAANFGYMFIAVLGLGLNAVIGDLRVALLSAGLSQEITEMLVGHSGWRLLMLCGAAPALLTLLIQLFVPESGRWQDERRRGATSHWDGRDLFGVLAGAAGGCALLALWTIKLPIAVRVGGTLAALVVITYGYLFPILRYLRRVEQAQGTGNGLRRSTVRRMLLAAALSGVALLGTWGSVQVAPTWADKLAGGQQNAKEYTQLMASFGAIVGCVLAALAGDRFGRRATYAVLCIASLGVVVAFYRLNTSYGTNFLVWAFLLGGVTAAFYGWLPLYLPELFRTKVRATGQGFGFNFGRIIAAVGVLQLPLVMTEMKVGYETACPVMALVYLVGVVLIWFAPETKGKPLPEDEPT